MPPVLLAPLLLLRLPLPLNLLLLHATRLGQSPLAADYPQQVWNSNNMNVDPSDMDVACVLYPRRLVGAVPVFSVLVFIQCIRADYRLLLTFSPTLVCCAASYLMH